MSKPQNRWFLAAGVALLFLGAGFTPVGEAAADSMKVQLVRIVNHVTDPVLVRDVEQPARQIFREMLLCTATAGEFTCEDRFFVPSGKLLIIETISASANLPTGHQPSVFCTIGLFPPTFGFALPVRNTSSGASTDFYSGIETVRLYAAAGEQVRLVFFRNQVSQTAGANLTVSGYLVDCGLGPGCPVPQGV